MIIQSQKKNMNNTTKALCLKGAKRYLSEKLDDLPQDCFLNTAKL